MRSMLRRAAVRPPRAGLLNDGPQAGVVLAGAVRGWFAHVGVGRSDVRPVEVDGTASDVPSVGASVVDASPVVAGPVGAAEGAVRDSDARVGAETATRTGTRRENAATATALRIMRVNPRT